MKKRIRRLLVCLAVAAGVVALAIASPSYTYVSVTGPDGEIRVEKAGFGPQRIRVETPGGSVESSTR